MGTFVRRPVTTLLFAIVCSWPSLASSATAQSTKPPQQPLYLPDPTPRQRDLSQQYPALPKSTLPNDPASQQEAARRRESHTQALLDADAILALADMLRDHAAHPESDGPAPPLDRMAVQKIEKLAKDLQARLSTK